jgi:tungstate transport system substrate-binding protein
VSLMNSVAALILVAWCSTAGALAAERFITVASTTSTDHSGLFRHLLPMYERDSGIGVRVVALGTGQALDLARRGDADVVLVHDTGAEQKFVAEGYGVKRRDLMYNDFVLVGPKANPARIAAGTDVVGALKRIEATKAPFVSRGDRSGTHGAELRLWKLAGLDPTTGRGRWYRETGAGMGPSLNTASAMNAYILTDRATWVSFRNPGELRIVCEGDPRLFNQYGVIMVSPARHPHVKRQWAQDFIDWLISARGQAAIASFRVRGQQLFYPNASRR